MGQYYTPIIEDRNSKRTTFSRQLVGSRQFIGNKLMEHSWWENQFVNTICTTIYNKPHKVAWVGDYADEFELYEEAMEKNKRVDVVENQTKLDGKYLINHTKKEYIDSDSYKAKATTTTGWCIHPLPLLTCVGNGMGGGDYFSEIGADKVGSWCWDYISVEDTIPDGYKKLDCYFM